MLIYNPKDEKVQFCFGGTWYYFEPKQSRDLDKVVAEHALNRGRCGLVVYTPKFDGEMTSTDMEYSKMPWRSLVQLASARGIFKPGTNRLVLEKDLKEYDEQQGRTVSIPSN